MKKLRLDIETLVVESFASSSRPASLGTVKGHDYTELSCNFDQCGGTQPGACETNVLGCGGGGSYFACTENAAYTCNLYQTCRQPCGFSDATNCHYCTENQTGVSYCPDGETRCIC